MNMDFHILSELPFTYDGIIVWGHIPLPCSALRTLTPSQLMASIMQNYFQVDERSGA